MSQANYISTFGLVDTICAELETRAYLWGGWIPDVYSKKILRQHDDAEHFIVDLYTHRSRLQSIFDDLNWITKVVENGDLVIKKDGMKFHFGHVEIAVNKALWYHNGQMGQIIFPKNWLNEEVLEFKGEHLHAVAPEFQYVLKLHPEFMNTGWKHREKDKADISVLESLLSKRGINPKSIDEKMFCYNTG